MNLCLLFPGQGSQYVGMGSGLFNTELGILLLKEAEDTLSLRLSSIMQSGSQEELTRTAIAQPAILLHSVSAFLHFKSRYNLNIDCAVGHSLGEYSALVAAGVVNFSDAIRAVHVRGTLMQEAVPQGQGAMAAILGLEVDKICSIVQEHSEKTDDEYAACANFNGPLQTVIAGTKEGVQKVCEKLKAAGAKRVVELMVSAPFHCALMKPVQQRMTAVLDGIKFSDAQFPVVSNVSAQPEKAKERIKSLLIEQIISPVRFSECIATASQLNAHNKTFIEFGPKNTLSGIVKKIDKESLIYNIDSFNDLETLKF
ncbi:MAG: ACP S-malonyltransferase [Myxococcales bacterium]|nr:ACP S-malonyltransferase [Myxococcales bacterium]USN50084.1 MAG: ACP S-malonyltransferase [Myxococcales bacterium]